MKKCYKSKEVLLSQDCKTTNDILKIIDKMNFEERFEFINDINKRKFTSIIIPPDGEFSSVFSFINHGKIFPFLLKSINVENNVKKYCEIKYVVSKGISCSVQYFYKNSNFTSQIYCKDFYKDGNWLEHLKFEPEGYSIISYLIENNGIKPQEIPEWYKQESYLHYLNLLNTQLMVADKEIDEVDENQKSLKKRIIFLENKQLKVSKKKSLFSKNDKISKIRKEQYLINTKIREYSNFKQKIFDCKNNLEKEKNDILKLLKNSNFNFLNNFQSKKTNENNSGIYKEYKLYEACDIFNSQNMTLTPIF